MNWGNYDLVVIDESHNFRNNDAFKDRETRYQKLMNQVIRAGREDQGADALGHPGQQPLQRPAQPAGAGLRRRLRKPQQEAAHRQDASRRSSATPRRPSTPGPSCRRRSAPPRAILDALDFDFFELLDSVTIARSRKHIQTFYDTKDIGHFPERRKPLSFHCPLTHRTDVMGFNDIFEQLSLLKLAVYAPISYILPSRLTKYEDLYDTQVAGGNGKLRQADREQSLQALMTINLLKRLESSVAVVPPHAAELCETTISATLGKIAELQADRQRRERRRPDRGASTNLDAEDDDLPDARTTSRSAARSRSAWPTWTCPRGSTTSRPISRIIDALLASMDKVTPDDDAKLQHLKAHHR